MSDFDEMTSTYMETEEQNMRRRFLESNFGRDVKSYQETESKISKGVVQCIHCEGTKVSVYKAPCNIHLLDFCKKCNGYGSLYWTEALFGKNEKALHPHQFYSAHLNSLEDRRNSAAILAFNIQEFCDKVLHTRERGFGLVLEIQDHPRMFSAEQRQISKIRLF